METKNEKYPEGYFTRIWMMAGIAIGAIIGIPLGIVFNRMELFMMGIPVGYALGLFIGLFIETKYKKEGKLRPLTMKEKKRIQLYVIIGIILFIIGVLVFLIY